MLTSSMDLREPRPQSHGALQHRVFLLGGGLGPARSINVKYGLVARGGRNETVEAADWAELRPPVLVVFGVLLYLVWGAIFNAFLDIGLYSIVVLLVGFGALGYYLYTIAPEGGKR